MAEKSFIEDSNKGLKRNDIAGYWELNAGDTAKPLSVPRFSLKAVHMFSPDESWNGAEVKLTGTIDPADCHYGVLTDDDKTDIVHTSNGAPRNVVPNCLSIKPEIVGGDSSTVVRVAIMAVE